MNNNDIFKKLRVALQLRDDQIVEILELVDFRVSKGEIGNLFRKEDHENFMECGDQVLRNFLNGLVIHLRGTKENPKNALDVINQNQQVVKRNIADKPKGDFKLKTDFKPNSEFKPKTDFKKTQGKAEHSTAKPASNTNFKNKKPAPKVQIVEKVQYKNGKNMKG